MVGVGGRGRKVKRGEEKSEWVPTILLPATRVKRECFTYSDDTYQDRSMNLRKILDIFFCRQYLELC